MLDRDGGIIWHCQGSGKSLVMVWLAKWIQENIDDPRVLIGFDAFVEAVWEIRHTRNQAAHTDPVPREAYSRLFRNVCQAGPLRVGALNALVRAWPAAPQLPHTTEKAP